MPLSLTTRRKQQTLSAKWSTQQHPAQHHNTDITATSTNIFRHNQHHANYLSQPFRKQKSLTENSYLNKTILTAHTGRAYLSRGLSIGRSHNIQRSSFPQKVLKKHSSITAESYNRKNEREILKTDDLIKKNINTIEQNDGGWNSGEFLQNSRHVWSSSSSILKTLDKELAQLNGVVKKCKDVKVSKERVNTADMAKSNKAKADSLTISGIHSSNSNRKQIKSEASKVNLSIVLSHTLESSKEENDCVLTEREVDEEDSDDTSSNSGKVLSSFPKPNNHEKHKNSSSCLKTISSSRPNVTAQQRRSLYRNSKLAVNLATSNNNHNTAVLHSGIQNFSTCPSVTVQKRAPLARAMSAPVRGFYETKKESATFLNTKKKSRRRKLNTRNASCDNKDSYNIVAAKNFSFDAKSTINNKVLTRSKSVAADVVTLVSLISSEGSDSEKEDKSLTTNNLHIDSLNKRAPFLRKTGKSVSFQENYPPTFQLASKEYSHMLRRGSIAPLAQRIKANRPPTAPPGSIYHTTQKLYNEMPISNNGVSEETKTNLEHIKNNVNKTLSETISDKTIEEEYQFPQYVHSLKERECWKLYMKMSTKGVNITYDTILRGMLTPTEFRQLQKQREIEEAKALKGADNALMAETSKRPPTAVERLKQSLLKN